MKKQDLKRIDKINIRLNKYGFSPISEKDALNCIDIFMAQSGQHLGWEILQHYKPQGMNSWDIENIFTRRQAQQIGDVLCNICQTYTNAKMH
jgi:hypothetical protein